MKKYLYSIVFATLILMSTTVVKASNEVYYTNRENVEMTEEEYNNLLGLGFSEKYIEGMDYEEFLNNKDLQGTLLSETVKYYRTTTIMRNGIKSRITREITEEEAMREKELQSQKVLNRGPVGSYYDGATSDGVVAVTTRISGVGNSYMRFNNTADWITIPSDRYNDIIGIGVESSKVQIASTIAFKEEWVTSGGTHSNTTVCAPAYTNTGGYAIFGLPTGSLQSLDITFYYNVSKKSGVGTLTSVYATGDYAHAYSNVSASNLSGHVTIGDTIGLIVTSPYSSSYSSMTPAIAYFLGTW